MTNDQITWLQNRFSFKHWEQLPVYGSKRLFYRLHGHEVKRLAIVDHDIHQFQSYIERSGLFSSLKVDVPSIYDYSDSLQIILVEDLGNTSLEKIVKTNKNRLQYYYQVIDNLTNWQKRFNNIVGSTNNNLPVFDFTFARNDTHLFTERFLRRYLGWSSIEIDSLNEYFDDLADQVSHIPKTLMHRDFQAENIMWYKDKPYIIDFQTAIIGPYTYDIASLVYDNHLNLSSNEKNKLIEYFFQSYPDYNREDLYPAALQRTFQALSAYAHLSLEQGKKQYEQYIPRAIEHLKELKIKSFVSLCLGGEREKCLQPT